MTKVISLAFIEFRLFTLCVCVCACECVEACELNWKLRDLMQKFLG